jgi:heterodisulfide reductase subunit A-like polyferredoxin
MNPKKPVVRQPSAKNCVTIFGGGVAGMTAAHELVERGFRV